MTADEPAATGPAGRAPGEAAAHDERVEVLAHLVGRRATCHGGGPVGPQAGVGARATYIGRLSGRRLSVGEPPWTWLEVVDLVEQPDDGAPVDRVWCDEHSVFIDDEP